MASLKQLLNRKEILLAPGVYDALTASLAASAGFEALYLSGAAIAYTRLGRPDIGLVSMTRGRRHAGADPRTRRDAAHRRRRHRLRQRAQRAAHGASVRARRRRGDPARGPDLPQALRPSRRQGRRSPTHGDGRQDPARRSTRGASEETLIIARTDAVAVEGFEAAIERARRLRGSGRGRAVRRGAARRASSSARSYARFGNARAADGEHGRGRPDADPLRRRACRRSASRSSSFPAASCARIARLRARFLRGAGARRHDRRLSRPACSTSTRSTSVIGTADMLARGRRYESGDRPEARPMTALDPVTLAVLKGRLEQIADEMDATLYRSAFNPDHRRGARRLPRPLSRRDRRDAGAGHDGPADLRRRHGVRGQGGDRQGRARRAGLEAGDTFLFNDPYDGGTHLNDFRLVRPSIAAASCSAGSPRSATGSTSAATCPAASTRARPRAFRKACASRRSS